MHFSRALASIAAAIACLPQAAAAQLSAPPIPSVLPGVAKISAANAAGVLRYCENNSLVSSTSADALLGQFANKLDVKSPEYLAGLGGQIRGDAGKNFSIGGAPSYLRLQACSMVLEQARTFPTVR
jgi:opacity protein-like surface antigen